MVPHAHISIHAPLTGRDCPAAALPFKLYVFQSTRPLRGATHGDRRKIIPGRISIHVPRTGHDEEDFNAAVQGLTISIHVPRTGHDSAERREGRYQRHFNPRAPYGARRNRVDLHRCNFDISIHVPRTGHDDAMRYPDNPHYAFQSTCPVRGTTAIAYGTPVEPEFQSTCPVRGTTP